MPQVPQLLLYMFIAVVTILILRELWRWIFMVHSRSFMGQTPPATSPRQGDHGDFLPSGIHRVAIRDSPVEAYVM